MLIISYFCFVFKVIIIIVRVSPVFFLVLLLCFFPTDFALPLLHKPVVYLNLLFLGIVASMLCYMVWNAAVQVLGASQTANYIYINPLVTLLTSALFLSETLTPVSLLGTACIIGGVYMAER